MTPEQEAQAREESENRQERLNKICQELQLTECLDSIAIMVTYSAEGITQSSVATRGNHYANVAVAERYVLDEKEAWRKGL